MRFFNIGFGGGTTNSKVLLVLISLSETRGVTSSGGLPRCDVTKLDCGGLEMLVGPLLF